MGILRTLLIFRKSVVLIVAPFVALPLLIIGTPQANCAFCVALMAIYWMCEALPLAVTALMPVFIFPLLGIMKSKDVAVTYLPDTSFLFIGGLIVAVAVEKCNLHQRIALRVLTVVGSQPRWIMLGFMSVTAFLSMWISNTAATAMMVPIAQSVIIELIKSSRKHHGVQVDARDDTQLTLLRSENNHEPAKNGTRIESEQEDAVTVENMTSDELSVAKGLLISICFAANIGGTGTITGTPPNLVLIGQLENLYPGASTGINFLSWMAFAIPSMVVALILCWLSLYLYFMRKSRPADENVNIMMREKYRNLPSMTFAEISVLICFCILLVMWIFRDPKVIPGFGDFFRKGYVTDATSAMIISFLLFVLPNEKPDFLCWRDRDTNDDPKVRGSLMDWKVMQEKFPWGVILLLGGGFALAGGVKESGLSHVIGGVLKELEGLPIIVIQLVCILITMGVTNICSNTVTASIFVPIVAGLAENLHIHPLTLMLPTTLACSFAFALPVGTPPNAIVFASGMIKVTDMIVSGLIVTVLCAIVVVLNIVTYGHILLSLDEYPSWAPGGASEVNSTLAF
uniref:Uncharacterized protein n=1 Tax=Plectus sambesii TaxID=2011161 RepID=A0A914VS54_9BILA